MDGLPLAAWRAALSAARDVEEARAIALRACAELERLHAEARARGIVLPRLTQPTLSTRIRPQ